MEYKQALEVLTQRRARGLNTVSVPCFRALKDEDKKDLIVNNQLRNYSQTLKLTPEERRHNQKVRERFGMVPGCRYQVIKEHKCVGFFGSEWHAKEYCDDEDDLAIWNDDRLMYVSRVYGKACAGREKLGELKWHREKDAILIDQE